MTVKSLKKQLMAAIAMVLVATIALGSSTYAWFAANNKVTANGMSITVQNNTAALLISGSTSTLADIQTAGLTVDTAAVASDVLYPAAHDAFATQAAVPTVGNWYYAKSDDPNDATMNVATKTALTTFNEYVLVNTFYITLAPGSDPMTNLKVDAITITGDPAARVIVQTTEGYQEFSTSLASGANTSGAVLAAALDDATVIPVNVYFYIDGNATNVYTNNFDNLVGTSVSIDFIAQ